MTLQAQSFSKNIVGAFMKIAILVFFIDEKKALENLTNSFQPTAPRSTENRALTI